MKYKYNNNFDLLINENVEQIFNNCMKAFRFKIEIGGIVAGILNPYSSQIEITDITRSQAKDEGRPYSFKRSPTGHQELMDKFWRESEYKKTYLGEWHTHRENIPHPSQIDKNNWIEISQRDHNSEWLFFIIVGMQEIGVWTLDHGKIVELEKF